MHPWPQATVNLATEEAKIVYKPSSGGVRELLEQVEDVGYTGHLK